MRNSDLFGRMQLREIGRYVREERERVGLTQAQVAEAAAMSSRAIRDLEAGRSNPSLSTMVAVADVLKLSLDELVAVAREAKLPVDFTSSSQVDKYAGVLTRSLDAPRLRARILNLPADAAATDPSDGALFSYAIQGEAGVSLDGGETVLRAGDSVHTRAGALLGLRGLGSGVRMLLVEADDARIFSNTGNNVRSAT